MPRLCSSLLLSLLIGSAASAVSMDWTFVGNPGNVCDSVFGGTCKGAVGYSYSVGTYEVTNAQYAEFLNAVAATDTNGLYSTNMPIARSGSPGSYTYSAIAILEQRPVNHVSWYDAVRFANWMQNGQPSGAQDVGTTEDGAYSITAQGIADNSIRRNADATIVLPTEDEWHKAAFYDASTAGYFDYPAGSSSPIVCSAPTPAPNSANCMDYDAAPNGRGLLNIGSYPGSPSPYGTFDQGGNASEWVETISDTYSRVIRGGSWADTSPALKSETSGYFLPTTESEVFGFRVAMIPEPGTGLLVAMGLVAIASRRRVR